MGSLGGISIGVSGLKVSQAALNITAHNLANVDTAGYVRQQAVLTDFNYVNVGNGFQSTLQQGNGVNFATVKQVRDIFLDQAYRQEIGRKAYYQTQYEAVGEIEGYFGELEGETFQGSLNKLWTSLQELAKEPDSVVTRASFVQTAVAFTERADNISKQLNDYQLNLNTQINEHVSRINEIGNTIKKLNLQIRQYEATGTEKANDLRDQRNGLLDELGKYAGMTYKEDANGIVNVKLEGADFVTDDTVFEMQAVPVSETSDMLKPVWISHGGVDVFNLNNPVSSENKNDVGLLKGLLTARGYKQANYTDIPHRENYETDTEYNEAVYDYNNKIEPSIIMTVQSQFDQLIHGITTTINDVLSPNKEVTLTDGTKIKILDEKNAPVGLDDNKTMGEALFNRKSISRYSEPQEIQIINEEGGYETVTARVYQEEDPKDEYSLFTAGQIEINPKILQNYAYIPLSSNSGSGDYDVKTANDLISKWQAEFTTLSPNTLTKNNFNNYYNSFISEIANRGEQFNTISTNQSSMLESIDSQRTAVTGVSSDDELSNMIKYQQAYNASARYISVVSDMLDNVVNKL
jgi:flagellar hook-associated protein FlgK